MTVKLLKMPLQVFTNDMSIARSLMNKSDPSRDETIQLGDHVTAVYNQPFNYLVTNPLGQGSHIDFDLLIDDANEGEVAEIVTRWLQEGRATIFSFDRIILNFDNIYETRLAIEEILKKLNEVCID